MKKFKNVFVLILLVLFVGVTQVSALTKWSYEDWITDGGFGTKKQVDANVTNLTGASEEDGMKVSAYVNKSNAKLDTGIKEEVNIELKSENYKNGEVFEVSLGIKNKDNVYVNEDVVATTKVADGFDIKVAGFDRSFHVSEDGVYTYRWNIYKQDSNTYLEFTLLRWDEVIDKTDKIDFDTVKGPDTKVPIASQEGVAFKYLWFCNIKADYGVNVYKDLPPKPETEVKPETKDDTVDKNPNTVDNYFIYFIGSIVGLSLFGYTIKKTILRFSKR